MSDIKEIISKLPAKPIHWFAISGTWRLTSQEVEDKVRGTVRKILTSGNGIISGGALGVDYFATDEALKFDPKLVKVFIPATMELHAAYYRKRAAEGVANKQQVELLAAQIKRLKQEGRLFEDFFNTELNMATYFHNNDEIIHAADALIAFRVNSSLGTGDAIEKAIEKNKPVKVYNFSIAHPNVQTKIIQE